MLKNISNLGKVLNKSAQKTIHGGRGSQGIEGDTVTWHYGCNDGLTGTAVGNENSDYVGIDCSNHGGLAYVIVA